jgi:hypothetical protein
MTDLILPAGTYTLYVDGTVRFLSRDEQVVVPGLVPGIFSDSDWSIELSAANTARITITSLPENNGQEIGYVEYRVNNGSWVSLNAPLGSFVVPLGNIFANDFQIRAVNFTGAGEPSEPKRIGTGSTFVIFPQSIEAFTEITEPVVTAGYLISVPNISVSSEITEPLVTSTPAPTGLIVFTFVEYVEGANKQGPKLYVENVVNQNTTAPYYLVFSTTGNGDTTAPTISEMDNETGDVLETVVFGPVNTIEEFDEEVKTLVTSVNSGNAWFYIKDSSPTPVTSSIVQVSTNNAIDVDATASTISNVSTSGITSTAANWSVTTNEAGGTIYVRVRLSSASAWTAEEIQNNPSDEVTPAVSG